ncbi:SHIRT domain-containing protein [Schaalia canis]|nr:SHIRT domain-containing protein [Schaalia canis]
MAGIALSVALTLGGITAAHADPQPQPQPGTPEITAVPAAMSLSDNPRIRAWQDLRFGLFIHWGVYSTFAGYYKGQKQWLGYPEQIKAWGIDRNNMGIPDEDYLKAASEMTIPNFSAQQWCQQAKDAGMKYLLVTSKHHDGFAMWDTATTHYDFYEKAPGQRDPMKELADACNGMGIKLAFYFSIIDWTKQTPDPWRNRNTLDAEMMTLIHDQLKELLSGKYGQVPELWFDMGNPTPEQSAQMAQWVREFSPNTLVNSRVWNDKGDFEVGGDNSLVTNLTMNPWESIRSTFPDCWGYCTWPEEEAIRKHPEGVAKQTKHEVENLFTTVANGGQYLLNVGPRGTGEFDPFESKILEGIGAWNTRHPHVIHGAVPTRYPQQTWGYTVINGNAVYLGVTRWPEDRTLRLPGAGTNVASVSVDDATAASPQALEYRVENNDLIITLPADAPDPALPIIKVETTGAPVYAPNTATTLVKGTMETVPRNAITEVNSPKRGAVSQLIAYAKNPGSETMNMAVALQGSVSRSENVKVTVGGKSRIATMGEFVDGLAGFDVPAHSIVPVMIEAADKAYYADSFSNDGTISKISLGGVDATQNAVTVEHQFVAADQSDLPPEVMAQLPASRQVIPGLKEVFPTDPQQRVVRLADGQWTFTGWNKNSQGTDTSPVVFVGTWTHGPLTYEVTYRFINATPDHEEPFQLKYFLPNAKEYPRGSSVTPPKLNSEVFRDFFNNKTWRFKGWKTERIEDLQSNVEIVGEWAYHRDTDVTVNFAFVSSDGSELPAEVTALLPPSFTKKAPVSFISPTTMIQNEVETPAGLWRFKGWDNPRISWPVGPTHTYTGTWVLTTKTHDVLFDYRSADPDKELPDSVIGTLPELLTVPHGSEVTLPLPEPARIEEGEGAWVFSGWEPASIPSISEDMEVVGTWTYQTKQKFTPTFTFESATEGATLPAEILALLPTGEEYTEGDTVTAPAPSQNTLTTPAGTWTFQGWTPERVENASEQVAFVGKWSLERAMHTVTYAFTSTSDKPLPDEVTALLPAAQTLAYGTVLEPAAPSATSWASIEGEWRFNGWNVKKETIVGDLTVTGTWTYHLREFSAKFSFPEDLPEAVQKMHSTEASLLIADNKVCAPAPLKNEVAVTGGSWRFEGWKKECYTLEEIAQHLTVNAQASGAGSGNGAALFALKDVSLIYALPFTPVWTFHKAQGPGPSDPKVPGVPAPKDDGKDKGSAGSTGKDGSTAGKDSDNTGKTTAPRSGLSKTGVDSSGLLFVSTIIVAAGTLLLIKRRRS